MDERIKRILMEDCAISEAEIAEMSKRGILNAILVEEGIIGYTGWIIELVQDIFGVSLDN